MSMVSERKAEMKILHNYDVEISDRSYNVVLGCSVIWGILVNILLCSMCGELMESIHPVVFYVGYFAFSFGGMALAYHSHNPFVSFIGYNMVVVPVGLVIAVTVELFGGMGSEIVGSAFLYTLIITACMIALASMFPRFFSKIGGVLLAALIGLLICGLVTSLLGVDQYWYAWVGAAIFSLYIGYDFYKSQTYVKTVDNAIDSAIAIYLDIANLFLKFLQILGRRR